ncbi:unnamed protein product [Strongylus vulgaris]|uniref:Uncharacterized protein n=1 Tax=Strongylus vulgaris TaxID=40348 RepID=A0A3P7K8P7_STRVU|nr:unnamed protein product [Strongylus vulgaris]
MYVPEEEIKISEENKLLANLFRERQLRRSQGGSQSAQSVSECPMDTSVKEGTIHFDSESTEARQSGGVVHSGASANDPDAAASSSSDVVVVTPPPVSVSKNAAINRESNSNVSEEAPKRKKKLSWRSLFKKFRRKMKHEKNSKKRERLYEFILDMKQELEKDLPSGYNRRIDREDDRGKGSSVLLPTQKYRKRKRRMSTKAGGGVHTLLTVPNPYFDNVRMTARKEVWFPRQKVNLKIGDIEVIAATKIRENLQEPFLHLVTIEDRVGHTEVLITKLKLCDV